MKELKEIVRNAAKEENLEVREEKQTKKNWVYDENNDSKKTKDKKAVARKKRQTE
jgi:hypothetical protein